MVAPSARGRRRVRQNTLLSQSWKSYCLTHLTKEWLFNNLSNVCSFVPSKTWTSGAGARFTSAEIGNSKGFSSLRTLSAIVTLIGAARMYAFERKLPDGTGGMTMLQRCGGRQRWPPILSIVLENDRAEIAGAKSIQTLQAEISALRTEIQALTRQDLNS